MRHGKKINHLGRTASHRSAMLSNMASSLIINKRISTTVAKAKALKKFVEPLVTKAKTDNTHSRRVVFSYLQDKNAVTELFGGIAEKVGSRPGGYTRIIKTGKRLGDAAETCLIELVDFNEIYSSASGSTAEGAKKSRRRGSKKSAASAEVVESEVIEVVGEDSTDDLKKIEGIGPKIAEILGEAGISTFAELAKADVEKLKEVLEAAGSRYKSKNPSSWPAQAELAANGQWEELKQWQKDNDANAEK